MDKDRITSSANSEIECDFCETRLPFMSGWDLIFLARGSIKRENNKGDNGHPCLVPLVILKLSENIPSEKNHS